MALIVAVLAALAQAEPPIEPAPEELVPPRLIGEPVIAWPSDAPIGAFEVEVVARLRVDENGEVEEVSLVQSGGEVFDVALLTALTHFRFEPARYRGEPVRIEITYSHLFVPPPPPSAERVTNARISGAIVEKGTRVPVKRATITFTSSEGEFRSESDDEGNFSLAVLASEGELEVYGTGYKRFLVKERAAAGEETRVRYLLERLSYNPYETIVTARPDRIEVARTTLRDREIHQIPGTFGDPFRVVGTLPGVGSIFSLLGYPVVRGTSPGNTGFLLDGVRVPQLYHLLAGPSVLHPDFIDRVDFYPGVFPVQYGGYTGGIVDGITRRAAPTERRYDFSIDFTNAGLLYRTPAPALGGTLTVAGRYGYPGLMLSLLQSEVYASYWDYQLRFDRPGTDEHTTLFVFGAFDEVGEKDDFAGDTTLARSMFHRATLRHRRGTESRYVVVDMTLGLDQVLSDDDSTTFTAWNVLPRISSFRKLTERLELRAGVDLNTRFSRGDTDVDDTVNISSNPQSLGFWVDLPWTASDGLTITPGARADFYRNDDVLKAGADPRLLVRKRLAEREVGDTWLKIGAGIFHQPPRFPIPIPGLDELALERGLLRSYQGSAGLEHQLGSMVLLDASIYYAHMDPIYLDLQASDVEDDNPEQEGENETLADLLPRRLGRSYGLELMLRHRDGGDLFGWISYTLSRSERRRPSGGWRRFDFDRPHMLHVVAGLKLPRNWEIGGRMQVQSGRPIYETGRSGFTRLDPFVRFDIRIDKRAVYNDWLLDFYVDVINLSLAPEEIDQSSGGLRYVLPTIGFRAVL